MTTPSLRVATLFVALIAATPSASAAPSATPDDPLERLGLVPKSGRVEDIDLKALLAVPVVQSSARRKQSLFEAVSDVTVITADELRNMPVGTIAEALRRVPGTHVMQHTANHADVGLRGINRLLSNYTLVLADGRNVSDLVFQAMQWGSLPFHRGDIERIEVLSGPGSTLYGANALTGVINIKTKRPLDHVGVEALFTAGAYFVDDATAWAPSRTRIVNGGTGYAAVNIANKAKTLGLRVSAGFAITPDWRDPDPVAAPVNGAHQYYVRTMGQYRSGPLEVLLTLSHAEMEADTLVTINTAPVPALIRQQSFGLSVVRKRLLGGALTLRGQLDGRRFYVLTRTRDEQDTVTISAEALTYHGHARVEAELSMFGGRNRLTVGGELTYQSTSRFFGVAPKMTYLGVFAQDDFVLLRKPGPRLLLSAAIRVEQVRSSGAGLDVTYNNINPRIGLVLNASNRHSVRLMAATSYRTPTPFENFIKATLPSGAGPPIDVVAPNPNLQPTVMRSIELGYRARWRRLRLDSTLFIQRVTDFTDWSQEIRLPIRMENLGSTTAIGGRIGVDIIGKRARGWAHYSLIKRLDDEGADWPTHIGGAGGQLELPWRMRINAMVSIWSVLRPDAVTYDLNDGTFDRARSKVSPQAILSLRVSRAIFKRSSLFFSAHNLLALGRDRQRLQQYSGSSPIGTSVLIGLDIKGL